MNDRIKVTINFKPFFIDYRVLFCFVLISVMDYLGFNFKYLEI